MHRATFFAGGRYVLSTGEKTDLISIYDVATGKMRGEAVEEEEEEDLIIEQTQYISHCEEAGQGAGVFVFVCACERLLTAALVCSFAQAQL
jgi:hypothetical protein